MFSVNALALPAGRQQHVGCTVPSLDFTVVEAAMNRVSWSLLENFPLTLLEGTRPAGTVGNRHRL
jgi:hypothetical protein